MNPHRTSPGTDGMLTIADIARHFSLPESTARYYCKRFASYMPCVGDGRRRRYRPETLQVVQCILDAMQTARNAAAVESTLAARFARNAEGDADQQDANLPAHCGTLHPAPLPDHALALLEQQTRAMEGIASALAMLAARQDELTALATSARNAEAEVTSLRREVATLRTLLDSAEKTHQQDLDQLRTWLGRIIAEKRKPARTA